MAVTMKVLANARRSRVCRPKASTPPATARTAPRDPASISDFASTKARAVEPITRGCSSRVLPPNVSVINATSASAMLPPSRLASWPNTMRRVVSSLSTTFVPMPRTFKAAITVHPRTKLQSAPRASRSRRIRFDSIQKRHATSP